MSDLDIVLKFWPILLSIVFVVAWFIRLESKALNTKEKLDVYINDSKQALSTHKEDVKLNQEKVWEKMEAIKDQSTEILKAVSRLEGKLQNNFNNSNIN